MKNESILGSSFRLTNPQLFGVTFFTALAYFFYSMLSDGFYQHDEIAHFLNMKRFWFDPSVILGNWAKPGYKIVFAPFSLLGYQAVTLINSVLAALTCLMAYKVAEEIDSRIPIFAFILLAFQPFWVQLSFRNYSEIFTAFLLITSIYSHYRSKFWLTALLLSYTSTIRQEMYPLLAIYGLYMILRKDWKAFLLLSTFPLMINFFGWIHSGNPFYLVSSIVGTSQNIQDAYPRLGFAHYFKMSVTIFGGMTLTFFLAYLFQSSVLKKKKHWIILIPLFIYFSFHVLFSIKFLEIGPATGGNLRYMLVISPLIAVLSGLGLERFIHLTKISEKKMTYFFLLPFAWIVLVFLTFDHDNVRFLFKRDYTPFIPVGLSLVIPLFSFSKKKYVYLVTLFSIISLCLLIRPIKISDEDRLVKDVVELSSELQFEDHPILVNHPLVYFRMNKVAEEFKYPVNRISEEKINDADIGTVIIWDSHYSYRPRLRHGDLKVQYFTDNPNKFKLVRGPFITPEGYFSIYIFMKVSH